MLDMVNKRNSWMLLVFCVGMVYSFAQNINSLELKIQNHKLEDTVRFNLMYQLYKQVRNVDPIRTTAIADSLSILAIKISDPDCIILANMAKGYSQIINHNYDASEEAYKKAFPYFEKAKRKSLAIDVYQTLAIIYSRKLNVPEALRYNQLALDAALKTNNIESAAQIYHNMGSMYFRNLDYDNTLKYALKTAEYCKKSGDTEVLSMAHENIGQSYFHKKQYRLAEDNYTLALDLARASGSNYSSGVAITNLVELFLEEKKYSDAFDYLVQKKVLESTDDNNSFYYLYAGKWYRDAPDSIYKIKKIAPERRYTMAMGLLDTAYHIAEVKKDILVQLNVLNELSGVYESQKNYQAAYTTFVHYKNVYDSFYNEKGRKDLARKEISYDYSKKMDSLKLLQMVTDGKFREQMLLNQQGQQRLELFNQNLLLTQKEKDLQHLAFLKTQDELQNAQLEKDKGLAQLSIAEKEEQLQKSQVASLQKDKKISQAEMQRLWLYALVTFLLLGLLTALILYNFRNRQLRLKAELAQEKAEKQLKQAEFTSKMNDVTLSALRSQMNPHFLFNCLNSIKLYTMENNNLAATEYLGKFSKLIRNMLDASRTDMITLSDELQSLKLYIELEAMRFKSKLTYEIKVDDHVDVNYTELPPLLIQPYIENAIWHGLMHKEEGGQVLLHISKLGNNFLQITITDNGVGRAKAAELKSKSAMKHKSHGIRVTAERIALIKEKYSIDANVSIIDLKDPNNQPAGTQVTIKLPLL